MTRVREGVAADRPAIDRALRATGAFSEEEVGVALELLDLSMSGRDPSYRFLCADADGRFAGYVCFGEIPLTRGSIDLYWIVVDPSAGRRGVGRALVDEMIARLRAEGARRVYVETSSRAPYAAARAFYLSAGFHLVVEFDDFYASSDAKLVFARDVVAVPTNTTTDRAKKAPRT